MTIKTVFLYRDSGENIAFRDASYYVTDVRDRFGLDGKRLYDSNGKPLFHGDEPPWNPPAHHLKQHPIERVEGEVVFDHEPTSDELRAAFPNYDKYEMLAKLRAKKRQDAREKADADYQESLKAELAEVEQQLRAG